MTEPTRLILPYSGLPAYLSVEIDGSGSLYVPTYQGAAQNHRTLYLVRDPQTGAWIKRITNNSAQTDLWYALKQDIYGDKRRKPFDYPTVEAVMNRMLARLVNNDILNEG